MQFVPIVNQTSEIIYINYQTTTGLIVSTSIPPGGAWTPPADTVVVYIVDKPDG